MEKPEFTKNIHLGEAPSHPYSKLGSYVTLIKVSFLLMMHFEIIRELEKIEEYCQLT